MLSFSDYRETQKPMFRLKLHVDEKDDYIPNRGIEVSQAAE
jgi:hypothetical protein